MLTITVPDSTYWDEVSEKFIDNKETTLQLEHSLVSLSKWESSWMVPFLGAEDKTEEQIISYIKDMTLTLDVSPEVYYRLTDDNFKQINEYIYAKMSATWFNEHRDPKGNRDVITSEIIYYWMISLTIPFECQFWHLNRLLTLVRVCNQKNAPQKKMSRSELASRNRSLNEQRKAKLNTTG